MKLIKVKTKATIRPAIFIGALLLCEAVQAVERAPTICPSYAAGMRVRYLSDANITIVDCLSSPDTSSAPTTMSFAANAS
jgi:hypothetical protein